mmetsp:Transcript_5600/g.8374  ORF Transcript_5600/g.8374 Transcript_5600/m.8374 type:complete len:83 (-) Transcript_5600:42-290(-)
MSVYQRNQSDFLDFITAGITPQWILKTSLGAEKCALSTDGLYLLLYDPSALEVWRYIGNILPQVKSLRQRHTPLPRYHLNLV